MLRRTVTTLRKSHFLCIFFLLCYTAHVVHLHTNNSFFREPGVSIRFSLSRHRSRIRRLNTICRFRDKPFSRVKVVTYQPFAVPTETSGLQVLHRRLAWLKWLMARTEPSGESAFLRSRWALAQAESSRG